MEEYAYLLLECRSLGYAADFLGIQKRYLLWIIEHYDLPTVKVKVRSNSVQHFISDKLLVKLFPRLSSFDNDTLSRQELLSSATDRVEEIEGTGIYFCFKGERIVYLGKTTDAARRFKEHASTRNKWFDKAVLLPFPVADLDYYETVYYLKFEPASNGKNFQQEILWQRLMNGFEYDRSLYYNTDTPIEVPKKVKQYLRTI